MAEEQKAQDYKLPDFLRDGFIPGGILLTLFVGVTLLDLGKAIYSKPQQAQAQQSSRTWTRENLLRKLMQEHPEEFTTEIDGYSITPRAMEYLREEDTGIVTLVRRDSTGQATLEPDIIIPFKTAMVGRAATIAGDSIITYPTIVQAHKEYTKDLWELSQREKQ